MSLTADQITAQNFKDFYGQIRPYLNGQVPTFANQFSRSDLYSTSEKIIGSFTDGKPIYQKTITSITMPQVVTDNVSVAESHNLTDYGINNVGEIVDYTFIVNTSDNAYLKDRQLSYADNVTTFFFNAWITYNSSNGFRLSIRSNRTFYNDATTKFTIQYTKSTDSAIKVGTGTDYSTDEQIIGTWIDGKPLYQKTIVDKTPVVTTDGTAATKRITISANLGKVISYNIYHEWGSGNSGGLLNDCYTITGGYTRYIRAFIDYSQNAIAIITDRDAFSNQDIYITIQYTKSTD